MKKLFLLIPVLFLFGCKAEDEIANDYACPGTPTVNYEGQVYNTVLIDNQCWLKENLNVGIMIMGNQEPTDNNQIEKHCYNNDPANCTIYGGLYQLHEMMQYVLTEGSQGICPNGWHIPTDSEWQNLIDYLGGDSIAGGKLKEAGYSHWESPNTGATDVSGFDALPGGAGFFTYFGYITNFEQIGQFSIFWGSTFSGSNNAWIRNIKFNYPNVGRFGAGKQHFCSIRCIKDE